MVFFMLASDQWMSGWLQDAVPSKLTRHTHTEHATQTPTGRELSVATFTIARSLWLAGSLPVAALSARVHASEAIGHQRIPSGP